MKKTIKTTKDFLKVLNKNPKTIILNNVYINIKIMPKKHGML